MNDLPQDTPFYCFDREAFTLKLPDGSRLRIPASGEVSAEAASGADPARFSPIIADSLFAASAIYAGRIPFIANAVLIGSKVLLLSDHSETRRDRLALRFAGLGYQVSDSMVAVDPVRLNVHLNGMPLVIPHELAEEVQAVSEPLFPQAACDRTGLASPAPDRAWPCLGMIAQIRPLPARTSASALTKLSDMQAYNMLSNRIFLRQMAEALLPSGEFHRTRLHMARTLGLYVFSPSADGGSTAEDAAFAYLHDEVRAWVTGEDTSPDTAPADGAGGLS